jgi:hypothetical protein
MGLATPEMGIGARIGPSVLEISGSRFHRYKIGTFIGWTKKSRGKLEANTDVAKRLSPSN